MLSKSLEDISFLTTLDERKQLLDNMMIDHMLIIEFNETIRNMSACDFIRLILVEKVRIRHLIVGYDQHIGRGREGDFQTISECAGKYGFSLEKIEGVSDSEGIISSTTIREALLSGHLEVANKYLGYSYSLGGRVIEGRRIGRVIGFPTANIRPEDPYKLIPADGVYAVKVELGKKLFGGMLSIGSNPTVSKDSALRSVEVHIFDINEDLYNREIRVYFKYRLRDEIRFDTLSALASQMELDRHQALRLLTDQ